MTTPAEVRQDPINRNNSQDHASSAQRRYGTDDEGTVVGEGSVRRHSLSRRAKDSHLAVSTDGLPQEDLDFRSIQSPSRLREETSRLGDDLTLLKAERQVSASEQDTRKSGVSRSKSVYRSRSKEEKDDFDIATSPSHEKVSIYRPPQNPNTSVGKIFKRVHDSVWLVRYFLYITPLVLLLLIPLLLGALLFKNATVGGVELVWFSIWLEIVWLSLWAGRILSKCLPWPIGLVSSLFTNNSKKWRDMGKQLEIPATLFFWTLALEISFLPTMKNHHADGNKETKEWESVMNKVIISIFVCAILNFAEKIIIQLIAISFHLRTYADRIDLNKFQIGSLTKLYKFSREKISEPDQDFETHSGGASGTRTPAQLVKEAQKNTVEAFKKIGDVTGKIAGDFAGKSVATSSHPHQVVLNLLSSTDGSQVLARRLYRTFCREGEENVHPDDLRPVFDDDEEAEAAFTMFDKDMNGDISIEELESVCVEIGRERKSITASLKDLDSVIGKLDSVFLFIAFIIAVLVFISLISTSAAGVLTSAGSTVLALSWLFSPTAQEFLQSIIFVFVKHPFDVGDRVSIYGNTGSSLKGDDYFVKEISLLYTEFKKMEGHIVQAPNSYLNQLFILNQRRSGGLAEAVPVVVKFGTTLDQIDSLRLRLLDFVTSEKREYQSNILTELRDITEAHSITLNVVFFYKSNWQNELLRLQRRNKFICALMVCMQELGIEGPRMRYPGQKESFPVYLQHVGHDIPLGGFPYDENSAPEQVEPPFVESSESTAGKDNPITRQTSILHPQGRKRGESLAQMGRRVDFSLGMQAVSASDLTGDVFEDRRSPRLPPTVSSPTRSAHSTSIGRSTSVSRGIGGAPLTRIGTDSTLARQRSNHRNRFFSRRGDRVLEDSDVMETGMADIPEKSYLDPRSGLISPTAWKTSSDTHRSGTVHSLPRPVREEWENDTRKVE